MRAYLACKYVGLDAYIDEYRLTSYLDESRRISRGGRAQQYRHSKATSGPASAFTAGNFHVSYFPCMSALLSRHKGLAISAAIFRRYLTTQSATATPGAASPSSQLVERVMTFTRHTITDEDGSLLSDELVAHATCFTAYFSSYHRAINNIEKKKKPPSAYIGQRPRLAITPNAYRRANYASIAATPADAE